MTAAMEVQQRWMHDSAVTMTPASIPLATPTLSPIASNGFTNNGNELNQAQTALMSVVVFFIMTVILLCFIAYMNWYVYLYRAFGSAICFQCVDC
jgi:hypothetical protein